MCFDNNSTNTTVVFTNTCKENEQSQNNTMCKEWKYDNKRLSKDNNIVLRPTWKMSDWNESKKKAVVVKADVKKQALTPVKKKDVNVKVCDENINPFEKQKKNNTILRKNDNIKKDIKNCVEVPLKQGCKKRDNYVLQLINKEINKDTDMRTKVSNVAQIYKRNYFVDGLKGKIRKQFKQNKEAIKVFSNILRDEESAVKRASMNSTIVKLTENPNRMRDKKRDTRNVCKLYAEMSNPAELITQALRSIGNHLGNGFVEGSSAALTQKITEMTANVPEERRGQNLSELLPNILKEIMGTITYPIKMKYTLSLIMHFLTTIIVMLSDASTNIKVICAGGFIGSLMCYSEIFVVDKLINDLLSFTGNTTNEEERLTAQNFQQDGEYLLTSIVKILLSVFSSQNLSEVKVNSGRIEKLVGLSRAIDSSKKITTFIKETWEFLVDNVNYYVYGIIKEDEFKQLHESMSDWFKGASKFLTIKEDEYKNIKGIAETIKEPEIQHLLCSLIKQGESIAIEITERKIKAGLAYTTFLSKLSELKKIAEENSVSILGFNAKHEPLIVYFYGKPGTGKTYAVENVPYSMYRALGESYNPSKDKFCKTDKSEYWDGYANQKVHVVDDFLQIRETEIKTQSVGEIMAIGSRSPMSLNMAKLGQKGHASYTSELVLITAQRLFNNTELQTLVESAEAFNRRIDVRIETTVKKEFQNNKGGLDRTKVNRDGFQDDVYIFKVKVRDVPKELELTYKQLILLLASLHKRKRDHEYARDNFGSIDVCASAEKIYNIIELIDKNEGDLSEMLRGMLVAEMMESEIPHHNIGNLSAIKERWALQWKAWFLGKANAPPRMVDLDAEVLITTIESENAIKRVKKRAKEALNDLTSWFSKYMGKESRKNWTIVHKTISIIVGAILFGTAAFGTYKLLGNLREKSSNKWERISTMEELQSESPPLNTRHIRKMRNFVESPALGLKKLRGRRNLMEADTTDDDYLTADSEGEKWSTEMPVVETNLRGDEILKRHTHICSKCKKEYSHFHEINGSHYEVAYQCPNKDCVWYYGKATKHRAQINPTRSTLMDEEIKTRMNLENYDKKILAEAAKDNIAIDIMEAIIANLCRVVRSTDNRSLNGLFISGTTCIFPKHLMHDHSHDEPMKLITPTMLDVEFTLKQVQYQETDTDVSLITFPQSMIQPKRDILKYFISENHIPHYSSSGLVVKYCKKHNIPMSMTVDNIQLTTQIEYYMSMTSDEVVHIPRSYSYSGHTRSGDCGAILMATETHIVKKLLGFHVCGGTSIGHSVILTEEKLRNWLKEVRVAHCEDMLVEICDEHTRKKFKNVEIVGKLKNGIVKTQSKQTKIVESLIHNKVRLNTSKPALLYKTVEHDPLMKGIVKAFEPDVFMKPHFLKLAIDDLVTQIKSYRNTTYLNSGVVENDKLVNGIESDSWMNAINMSSSPGHPWNFSDGKGKEKLVFGELPNAILKEDILYRMEDVISKCRKNIIPSMMFIDTLKDETRSIDKVDAGKTRVFSVGSLEDMLAIRKYYLNFVCHMMENHIEGECSVGLNVHDETWETFYCLLKSKGDLWIAGDYSAYDKKLPYQVLMACADVVNKVMGDEENFLIRTNLMKACVDGYRVADGVVYRAHHGMPSGVPITAVCNSICNSLLFRYMFLEIYTRIFNSEKIAETFFSHFNQNVAIRCYGDDHIIRVTKSFGEYFNMSTLNEIFSVFNIEYTTTDKKQITHHFVDESELTYLKRKFAVYDGLFCAPLEEDSIYEMYNWIKKSEDPKEATKVNVEMALNEWTHHGKKRWIEEFNKVKLACAEAHIPLGELNYEICRNTITSGEDVVSVIASYMKYPNQVDCAAKKQTSVQTFLSPSGINGTINIEKGSPLVKYSDALRGNNVTANNLKNNKCELEQEIELMKIGEKTLEQQVVESNMNKAKNDRKNDREIFYKSLVAQAGSDNLQDETSELKEQDANEIGITKFVDQENAVKTIIPGEGMVRDLSVYRLQTIKEFVERPYLISNFEWTTGLKKHAKIIKFPDVLFRIKALFAKLKNFRYFRGDLKITVKVNGTKFHYGKLLCAWVPRPRQGLYERVFTTSTGKFSFRNVGMTSMQFFAACNHMQVSPTANETQTLVIPYQCPNTFVDLDDLTSASSAEVFDERYAFAEMGELHVLVLNPIRGATTADVPPVDVSIFANFENVQLEGYDVNDRTWFSGAVPEVSTVLHEPDRLLNIMKGTINPYKPSNSGGVVEIQERLIAQVGNEEPEQRKKANSRILSNALSAVSHVAGGLSFIPAPSAIPLKVASGLTAGAGAIARYFGYQRPTNIEKEQVMTIQYPNLSHTKGIDTAYVVGLDPENKVSNGEDFTKGNEQEMIINKVISRPGLLLQTKVDLSTEAGTILFKIPVLPTVDPARDYPNYSAWWMTMKTPLSYMASLFSYWRGSIQYKLQIIASSFHTGRLRIAWLPSSQDPYTYNPLVDLTNVVSQVVDVNTDTDIDFTVPYLREWIYSATSPRYGKNLSIENGYIIVSVVNTISSMSKDAGPIELNLWVSGSNDMQFGKLNQTMQEHLSPEDYNTTPSYPPIYRKVPNVSGLEFDSHSSYQNKIYEEEQEKNCEEAKEGRLYAQVGHEDLEDTFENPTTAISFFDGKQYREHDLCMGERVDHIKDIVGRPGYIGKVESTKTAIITPGGHLNSSAYMDFVSYFLRIFRFWRGSLGYKVLTYSNTWVDVRIDTAPPYTTGVLGSGTREAYLMISSGNGFYKPAFSSNSMAEFVVPYYTGSLMQPSRWYDTYSTQGSYVAKATSSTDLYVLQYAGDDFKLIHQIGVPVLATTKVMYTPMVDPHAVQGV